MKRASRFIKPGMMMDRWAGFAESRENKQRKAMKTKNNVQKTMLRVAAVVFSFVLVSYTVSAQGFWKRFLESSSFGHLASVMVDTEAATPNASQANTDGLGIFFETAVEADLELEPWMMDETRFLQAASESGPNDTLERAGAVPETNTGGLYGDLEPEAGLEIERWMVSDRVWGK